MASEIISKSIGSYRHSATIPQNNLISTERQSLLPSKATVNRSINSAKGNTSRQSSYLSLAAVTTSSTVATSDPISSIQLPLQTSVRTYVAPQSLVTTYDWLSTIA